MANYLISGGTGFIGNELTKILLKKGHQVFILTTNKNLHLSSSIKEVKYVHWDPSHQIIDPSFQLQDAFLINLAGASVADKRWTKMRKQEILESRVNSLKTIYAAIEKKQLHITHLVSASAIGYYNADDTLHKESDPGDHHFLSQTCQQWEAEALRFKQLQLGVAIVRIGIVLGKEGGALKEFLNPLQFGIAGIPSNGRQIYSWIHLHDIASLFEYLASHRKEGIYNGVAPQPSSVNEIFAELIQHTKPFFFKAHAPDFFLKMLLGEMSVEVLKSCKVSSQKVIDDGFTFSFPGIHEAVNDIMRPN